MRCRSGWGRSANGATDGAVTAELRGDAPARWLGNAGPCFRRGVCLFSPCYFALSKSLIPHGDCRSCSIAPPLFFLNLPLLKLVFPSEEFGGEGGGHPPRPQAHSQKAAAQGFAANEAPGDLRGPRKGRPARIPHFDPGTSAQLAKSLRPRSAASIEFDVDAASDGVVKKRANSISLKSAKCLSLVPASRRNLDGLRLPAPSPSPRATGAAV